MMSLMKMRWRDYSVMFLHRLEMMKDEKRLESDRICSRLRQAEFNRHYEMEGEIEYLSVD
jgi:hypothetical protein